MYPFCQCLQNSKAGSECNIQGGKFVRLCVCRPHSGTLRPTCFIHIIFIRKENLFEVVNKANPPRLFVIFSDKVVPYSQTSNPVYNTVRNEIRRIDNFGEKEIRRKGKNINWIVEYTHPGITIKATGIKPDSSTNFFIFLPPLNLPGKASRICKCWFDDVVSVRGVRATATRRRVPSRRVASWRVVSRSLPPPPRLLLTWILSFMTWCRDVSVPSYERLLITCTFIASRSSKICSSAVARWNLL